MKITKIPGLGRFGVFIDDVDLNTISHEEWMEIGKIHLETLVTIIRHDKFDYKRYGDLIDQWGTPRWNFPLNIYRKYGKTAKEAFFANELEESDRLILDAARRWPIDRNYEIVRVSPKKDRLGRNIGVFGDGELKWHSNECGNSWFTPGVALMGYESMVGSSTGFLTTTDYYESVSESFRSELDDMIVIHNYKSAMINPTMVESQESFYKNNMCPDENSRVPLIIQSPGGIRGIHLGINTFDRIEGMTETESKALFDRLEKELFVEKYIYNHWYQHDGDLCLFDNSIVLHNRTIKDNGTLPDRVGLRVQFDYDKLTDGPYRPFFQDEFNRHREEMLELYQKSISLN